MIVSPIPGQTPDRSSEHTLQGLASNLNAYAEQWTRIDTAGTNTDLTPAQVIAKNIVLRAGASGAFTLTLPPTSKIIDALGPTVSNDGTFWFPLYIFNYLVGQTATLTAADGGSVIDPINAAIPDGHVNKWMVNVEALPANKGVLTLNFHSVFSVCCAGVQPQTCPPDLPPVLLIFGQAPNPNEVLQYDITQPGTDKPRLLSAGFLGSGTITYAPQTFDSSGPSAIYNVRDDKMYFTADKTDSSGPTTTAMLVQFDPRTLVITGEMALPLGGTAADYIFIDVADQSAWIHCNGDGSTREFDVVSFTELFNDSGALATLASATTAGIACNSGQFLLPDAVSATTIHLITVTSATTFTDTAITVSYQGDWAEDGANRRRWIMDRNKVVIPNGPIFGAPVYAVLVDLNDLSVMAAYAGTTDTVSFGRGPFWDPYLHRVVGFTLGPTGGAFVGDDTGATIGFIVNGSWIPLGQTLGGLALAEGGPTDSLGGFDETTVSSTPVEIYQRNDGFMFPNGQTFNSSNLCISPKRKDCLPIDPPQRGGAEWVSPVFHSYVPFTEGSSGQTITDSGGGSLQYFNAIDTAGWFDVPVGSPGGIAFTPKIRGYYVVEFGVSAQASTGSAVAFVNVVSPTPPGAGFALNSFDNVAFWSGSASDIVHCNGDTDQISINCQADAGHTWIPGVASPFEPNGSCYFNVWLLKRD